MIDDSVRVVESLVGLVGFVGYVGYVEFVRCLGKPGAPRQFAFFLSSPESISHSLIGESRRLCHGKGIEIVERLPIICIGDPIIHVEIRDRRCEARIALIEGREGVH